MRRRRPDKAMDGLGALVRAAEAARELAARGLGHGGAPSRRGAQKPGSMTLGTVLVDTGIEERAPTITGAETGGDMGGGSMWTGRL